MLFHRHNQSNKTVLVFFLQNKHLDLGFFVLSYFFRAYLLFWYHFTLYFIQQRLKRKNEVARGYITGNESDTGFINTADGVRAIVVVVVVVVVTLGRASVRTAALTGVFGQL